MTVTDRDKEELVPYAAVFINPLLRQKPQVSYKIPIYANGTGSPKIGDLVIEPDAKVGIKVKEVEDTPEGPRVIAVYKPTQKPSYRNKPTFPFLRSLREQLDHHVEAQGKYRERAKELRVQDIPYNQLPLSENAAYAEYGSELNAGEFGFATASTDDSGVYVRKYPSIESFRKVEWENSNPNTTEIEKIRTRVIRHIIETRFDEELEKREKEKVVRDATARIVYDTIVEKSKEGKVRTMSNITVYCYTEDRGADMIELGADVIISTGMTIRGGQVISDHKYFSDDVLRELKTVGINGFDSNSVLYLKRIGKPKIASLTRPVLSSKGVLLPYTHSVLAKYIGHIPRNTFQLIYEHFLATA